MVSIYIYIFCFFCIRQRQMRRILEKICTSPRTRLAQRLCWSTCPSDFPSLLPCRMDGNAGSCLGRSGPDRVLLCCLGVCLFNGHRTGQPSMNEREFHYPDPGWTFQRSRWGQRKGQDASLFLPNTLSILLGVLCAILAVKVLGEGHAVKIGTGLQRNIVSQFHTLQISYTLTSAINQLIN